MFDLCLFDLDDTLVRTSDMDSLRRAGKNVQTDEYKEAVSIAYRSQDNRPIYSEALLNNLRSKFPNMKFGIFTRSPASYAERILELAYPRFKWEVGIAFENVAKTKPSGEGIVKAMDKLGYKQLDRVVLVGDGDNDVRAAYNAGIPVIVDKASWQRKFSNDNWHALNHMPDAIIEGPAYLEAALKSLTAYQLDLERALSGSPSPITGRRFDRIGKFIPRELGGGNTAYQIFTCGRSFSNHASLSERRKWHALSNSIQENKESSIFPEEWISSISAFIKKQYRSINTGPSIVVTVVPHRPGRKPRLENMLKQLETSLSMDSTIFREKLEFESELLAYRQGVRSHSKEFLGGNDRFSNVRDHLYVKNPQIVDQGKRVLVIDDVCTTGASLIYAGIRLEEAGSGDVTRLSISMNISDVLRYA